jgi:hypothetical protein
MKRSVVRQSEKLADSSKRGKRLVHRGLSKRVATLIGSLESVIPDLAENHRRYILKSLTKSE